MSEIKKQIKQLEQKLHSLKSYQDQLNLPEIYFQSLITLKIFSNNAKNCSNPYPLSHRTKNNPYPSPSAKSTIRLWNKISSNISFICLRLGRIKIRISRIRRIWFWIFLRRIQWVCLILGIKFCCGQLGFKTKILPNIIIHTGI